VAVEGFKSPRRYSGSPDLFNKGQIMRNSMHELPLATSLSKGISRSGFVKKA
jgi:hypothetical protein